jgi:hypothetical protein
MNGNGFKTLLILAVCGWGLWKMFDKWLGPAVTPGEVTILTAGNFPEVRRAAGTLVAIYMTPG